MHRIELYNQRKKPLQPRPVWGPCPSLHSVGGGGEWAVVSSLYTTRGRIKWTEHATSVALPGLGRGTAAYFSGPVMGSAGSSPFPSPQVGSGRRQIFSPGPSLEPSSVTEGQPQGTGGILGTEETGYAPAVATVMTSAPTTTTDQSPAQAEARPSPQ